MSERRSERSNPEKRTLAFFDQSYGTLAKQLQDMVIVFHGTNKKILLTSLQPWAKKDVGKRYRAMDQMQPGDFWAHRLAIRRMRQSLIVAKDRDRVGACVRILRASYFDTRKGTFTPMLREGDIATFFRLRDNEIGQLKFLDSSDTLYLVRSKHSGAITTGGTRVNPEDANRELGKLLISQQ